MFFKILKKQMSGHVKTPSVPPNPLRPQRVNETHVNGISDESRQRIIGDEVHDRVAME